MKKSELDTPSLIIDIDLFEQNLKTMAACASRVQKKLRPHAKTHKCPEIAKRQLAAGNCIGICVAKVSEAEKMAQAKIQDILITSPVVTPQKIKKLIRLHNALQNLMVVVDNPINIRMLAEAAKEASKPLKVLVDLDPEMGRTGVPFSDALEMGKQISSFSSLHLQGIQCYCGHLQHIRNYRERQQQSFFYMKRAADVFHSFQKAGLSCDIFTGTGTGTCSADLQIPELTDIQVGSYCVMDAEYSPISESRGTLCDIFHPSLTMLTSVISTNHSDYITIDAGTKALYVTPQAPPFILRDGKTNPNWVYDWSFGDEHGRVKCPPSEKPALGSTLELIVSHCDPTINLFDQFFIAKGDEIIDTWDISLRGCCQ
ncbi:MAG: DSD1 family PLP-dependent enzyme [Lentisphaeria bacterium]